MPEVDIQRLLGPEAREIFMQFPLPLALVNDSGPNQFNDHFTRFFGHHCLDTTALRDILDTPGQGWRPISLTARDGSKTSFMHRP
jgi:hypothetical protein